jgi:hypothetical protein
LNALLRCAKGVFVKPIAEAFDNSVDVQPSESLENYIAQRFTRSTRAASMRTTVSDRARFQSSANSDSLRPVRGAAMDVGTRLLVAFPGDYGDPSGSIDRRRY